VAWQNEDRVDWRLTVDGPASSKKTPSAAAQRHQQLKILQQNRYANLAQALDGVEGVDIPPGHQGKTAVSDISIRGLPRIHAYSVDGSPRQNTCGTSPQWL